MEKVYNQRFGDCQSWAFFNEKAFLEPSWKSCYNGVGNTAGKIIYLANFRCQDTEKYIPLIIRVINKITPCALVEYKGKEYISFTTVGSYDANLVLLRFIKMLWDNRPSKEAQLFFLEELSKSKFNDMFAKLTTALKKTVDKYYDKENGLHTSPFCGGKVVVKDTEDFKHFIEQPNDYDMDGYMHATKKFFNAPSLHRKPIAKK